MFMTTYLAYSAQRSFVFTNYTWNKDGSAYSTFDNGRKIPSQIPLSALITGPMVGGPMPIGSNAPRFVKKEWFDKVCPKAERTIIRTEDVTNGLSDASGQETLEAWVKKLDSLPDRCIEIAEDSIQVFSIWLFGSPRILDIFPGLSKSPIMANFGWSSLITSIYANNRQLFEPNTEQRVLSWFGSASSAANVDQKAMIPGLLVLHIRRGDFEGHCRNLAVWNSGFNGFNSFPELPDHFTPAPWHEWSETRPEHYDLFLPHCFPSIDEIVEKVQHIRKTSAGKGLRNVFIMTNGATEWVAELKQAMRLAAPWEKIASSRDMELTWEQKFVAQAADMLIGQKAQVFVGNGFSSLTSNIVMLRMAHGFAPESTRLW
ncbi:hypothetical protein PUNSTDRAFT_49122 [Punctularia strigosozonata HHB-11173 SS5]|uniref:uncharacterized protein n=1 Tax=Punctularia strigosozonata (strain HHB-11173) TaxID=741275 RepID=UPI0004416C23|nr:uncharacterized protein PUNSTDRAFT_49122 [Punctularia strigosozonata HHB-11173 SS5]EIN14296.1 hypothetical protein PUNSTDRAFT_49122 [Punctularia strigosozonata HHB-11173 SS5]